LGSEAVKIEVDLICPKLAVPLLYLYFVAAFVFKLLAKMATCQGFGVFSLIHAFRSGTFLSYSSFELELIFFFMKLR